MRREKKELEFPFSKTTAVARPSPGPRLRPLVSSARCRSGHFLVSHGQSPHRTSSGRHPRGPPPDALPPPRSPRPVTSSMSLPSECPPKSSALPELSESPGTRLAQAASSTRSAKKTHTHTFAHNKGTERESRTASLGTERLAGSPLRGKRAPRPHPSEPPKLSQVSLEPERGKQIGRISHFVNLIFESKCHGSPAAADREGGTVMET